MKTQKVFQTGHSLALTIPSSFVKITGIKKGQKAKVNINHRKASLTYIFLETRQLPLKIK